MNARMTKAYIKTRRMAVMKYRLHGAPYSVQGELITQTKALVVRQKELTEVMQVLNNRISIAMGLATQIATILKWAIAIAITVCLLAETAIKIFGK